VGVQRSLADWPYNEVELFHGVFYIWIPFVADSEIYNTFLFNMHFFAIILTHFVRISLFLHKSGGLCIRKDLG
jgi:hypothetical protein